MDKQDQRIYLVYITRDNVEGTRDFYFLTEDDRLVGDVAQAKQFKSYADTFEPIWDGILWEQNEKLKHLGFRRCSYIPLSEVGNIKPEWRGQDEVSLTRDN